MTRANVTGSTSTTSTTSLWSKLTTPAAGDTWSAPRSGRSNRHDTGRTVPAMAMLRRIRALLEPAGITRLADLTGLDYLGIPVYQAVRPGSRNLSVSQGKGVTKAHAKLSALMESLEFFHAEQVRAERMVAPLGAMRPSLRYDPATLLRPPWGELTDQLDIEWVAATSLVDGTPSYVPVQLCELNATVTERLARTTFLSASNGLASGGTFLEAVCHGLYELIERDAVAADEALRFSAERALRCDTVDGTVCRWLIDTMRSAGRLHVHVPRSPTERPCFEAFFEADDIPQQTFFGAGCHPRRRVALARALVEAAQSRLTYIAGARDDLDTRDYPRHGSTAAVELPVATGPAWPDRPKVVFSQLPEARPDDPLTDLRELATLVQASTGASPVAVDLSREEMGLPVVFVVAPGLNVNHYRH